MIPLARDLLREMRDVNKRLLTEPQSKFLENLLFVLESESKKCALNDLFNEAKNNRICIQMRELQQTFKSIIRHLKNGEVSRQKFLETYPRWLDLREDSVKRLREIAKDINSDRFKCNISQVVGHSASAIGGAMCLTSAILIPFTLGLTTPLAIAGGSITAVGCSTSIGTWIAEITRLKKNVGEAQEIVKKDKDAYVELSHWLTRAQELEEALNEVLNIDIAKDIKGAVEKLTRQIIELYREPDTSEMKVITKLKQIFRILPEPLQTSIPLSSIGLYLFILVAIRLLYLNKENRIVIDLASVTLRGLVGFFSLLDNSQDIARIASLFTSNTVLANNIGKAVFKGVFSAAGIALDVIGIFATSIDMVKGSCAPEADKIEKAADELEKEATLLKEVHQNLMNPPKSKTRKPQIIIYNVWSNFRNEELEEIISNDNQLERQEIKVQFKFRTERGWYWVLEVGPYNFACMMRKPKIKLGRRTFNFAEYNKPLICYRCGTFGHKQSLCRNRQICFRCGAQGHKSSNCTSSSFHCINCSKHNKKFSTKFDVKHPCFSRHCSSLKFEIDSQRDITDYEGYQSTLIDI